MKNQYANSRCIYLAFIVAVIFLVGCTSEKEISELPDNPSQEQTEKTIPPNDVKKETASGEIITIYAQLFPEHTKGPVQFSHDRHGKDYSIACNECHHIYENGVNVWEEGMEVKKCEICHNEPTVAGENTLSPDLQKKNLKLAFHNNCRVCHRKVKSDNPTSSAPTTCTGCHEKVK